MPQITCLQIIHLAHPFLASHTRGSRFSTLGADIDGLKNVQEKVWILPWPQWFPI